MGREVRRVAPDWEHPKDYAGRYRPLFDGCTYHSAVKAWKEGYAAWERGERPEYFEPAEYPNGCEYWDWDSGPPMAEDYMPPWTEAEATHYRMYEDTSEGTPISPAFATVEELARWLADNQASAFGGMTATYEQWLATCRAGSSMGSFVLNTGTGVMKSGVAAMLDIDGTEAK